VTVRPHRVVVLPGDGIGPEVTDAGLRVLAAVAAREGVEIETESLPAGAVAIERHGDPLPEFVERAARAADAVLLGAVGQAAPPPPEAPRPEEAILRLRGALGAFADVRRGRCLPGLEHVSALRPEVAAATDVLVVREVGGGIFASDPRGRERTAAGRVAVDTCRYAEHEIRRVVAVACDLAAARRGHVASVDKANVMHTSRLWREVATEVAAERTDVEVEHVLVDAAAARLVSAPGSFDVLVTENLFGDILSDALAGLVGSTAMVASANLGGPTGLFEPMHGSAPDIAGRGMANPVGMVLAVAQLLDAGLGEPAAAAAVEDALLDALAGGARTADIARPGEAVLTTGAFADRVVAALDEPGGGGAGRAREAVARA
jgi:3-isopropylmalate dehydrogenase